MVTCSNTSTLALQQDPNYDGRSAYRIKLVSNSFFCRQLLLFLGEKLLCILAVAALPRNEDFEDKTKEFQAIMRILSPID